MYQVLIDTSVWFAIAGNPKRFRELAIVEEMVRRGTIQLIVPTLAILEFNKNRQNFAHRTETELQPHAREVRKAALRMGGPEKKVAAFLEHLNHLATQAPIEEGGPGQVLDRIERLLLASPAIKRSDEITEAAVQRGLDKRAPFHDRNGMADAILIETYGHCVRENTDPTMRFAFITCDKDDFSAEQGNHNLPHPDIEEFFVSGKSHFFFDLLRALKHFDDSIVSAVLSRDEPTVADVLKQYVEAVAIGQSGEMTLRKISGMPIGAKKVSKLKPSDYLDHVLLRRKTTAPPTVQQDIVYLSIAFKWAIQNLGASISIEALDSARQAATKQGLISKSRQREVRRLSVEDEQRLAERLAIVKKHTKKLIDMGTLMPFAIWSTRRADEICRLEWKDFDEKTGMCKVRNVFNTGKDLPFRLVGKALEIVLKQKEISGKGKLIFPYNAKSMGAKFRVAKNQLKIDITFDDLREEGIRRLIESKQYTTDVISEAVGDPRKVWDVKQELDAKAG